MQGEDSPLTVLLRYRDSVTNADAASLLTERLIYIAVSQEVRGVSHPGIPDIKDIIVEYIHGQNKKIMNLEMDFNQKLHNISKCLDILAIKTVRNRISPFEAQLQLRALCLSNLSILYKQNNQLQDSLLAVDAALAIEQTLLQKKYKQAIANVSSTYINKCAILSEMNNHEEAAETMTKALKHLAQYLETNKQRMLPQEIQDLNYTKMFAHFNLAVEYEHLGLISLAVQHFQIAYREAKGVGDWQVRSKVVQALKILRKR